MVNENNVVAQEAKLIEVSYGEVLTEIKSRLAAGRMRVLLAANLEMLKTYREIGQVLITHGEAGKWGDKLFDRLAKDLQASFPGVKGFSKTNLKNMRLFARHYSANEIGQALPDQLTWTHHVVLMQNFEPEQIQEKRWYADQAIANGWPYRKLREQIQLKLYERQGALSEKTTNFKERLPAPQSELAEEMIKEPYKFNFIAMGDDLLEKDLHRGMELHIRQFLMELGQGFAFYASHYPIVVSNKRFEIDLLMYNTKLHCYVVIEFKRGEFHPSHTGQLNFYLSAVDEQLKMPEDGPTMGLLLCEKKDKIIAEYALRRVNSPMGVSEYQLAKSLPDDLKSVFPTTEEIEEELNEWKK